MASKVWNEITYPFPNFNGATVEVWEWLSNFIPHVYSYLAHGYYYSNCYYPIGNNGYNIQQCTQLLFESGVMSPGAPFTNVD